MPHMIERGILKPYLAVSQFFWKKLDMKVVDATVDFIARIVYSTGDKARVMQSGNLSKMLRLMVAGVVLLFVLAVAYIYGMAK